MNNTGLKYINNNSEVITQILSDKKICFILRTKI